jgi:hypothetical protein
MSLFEARADDLLLVIDMQMGFKSPVTDKITPAILELITNVYLVPTRLFPELPTFIRTI